MEMITCENGSSSSTTDSVFSGFGSSSGLNTPVGSDLDQSSESEEDDFMAELTRQIAENMLLEDDHKPPPVSHTATHQCYQHQGAEKKSDHHQPQPKKKEYVKRSPGFLSAGQVGSGMRLVFLGGSGSSNGTGVFLPTNNNIIINPTDNHRHHYHTNQYRKKPVCSTVLIPERVLQTLKQLHDKRSNAPTHGRLGLHTQMINQRLQSKDNDNNTNNQELQLPQEWTY